MAANPGDSNEKKQNVVVFFCDQLRLDILSCYGGRVVRTQNLQHLADDSVVFDRAYTPTAICSPARASLMTGLYAHNHHMFNNSSPRYSYCEHLRPDRNMVQDWVRNHTDYQSGYFGKWHIGPAGDLFASRFHRTHPRPYDGGPYYLANSHWHPSHRLGEPARSVANGYAGTVKMPFEDFPDVAAARYTTDFMREQVERGNPFIAFCAFPGPHSPWVIPEDFGIRYRPREIPPWPNVCDPMEGKPLYQKKLHRLSDNYKEKQGVDFRETHVLQELMACLFSYMELIDTQVGEVVSCLKELGIYEDTWIVFTADHGDMAGSHGFISKGSYMYDEIYRIPLIVKPSGSSAVSRVESPVHLMDVTATLLHVMGGQPVDSMDTHTIDGQSLVPIISGDRTSLRPMAMGEYHGDWYGHYSARMVTDGKVKLVWNLTDLCELYDLERDPYELHNVFYDASYRDVRDRCFDELIKQAKETDDAHVVMYDPAVEDVLSSPA